MTETGLSLGTPHYMSPEQATAEKEVTARSDIYSLGSVLYEMLTGNPPHTGASAQQIIMKIVTEDAQPVTRLRKSVPPNVAAAVAKSLQKLPLQLARAYFLSFLCYLLLAAVMDYLIVRLGIDTPQGGAKLGATLWAGFVLSLVYYAWFEIVR